MEEILLQLGLTDKEASLYLLLLQTPHLTAQQMADSTQIQRTNVYRLLDNLLSMEIITADHSAVKRFTAAEPQTLQKLLQNKQNELKQTANSLSSLMPAFRSQYSLSLDKPGVFHMAGTEGFERLLHDMVKSKTDVLLVASDDIPNDEDTLERFRNLLTERRNNGVATRALFHGEPNEQIQQTFAERGLEVRFIGDTPFKGEIALYEDNVAFTVYDPSIIVTVLTNQLIAATMRTIFEELWAVAKDSSR
jgi:sugar-specific transcriptional regulator TrmB